MGETFFTSKDAAKITGCTLRQLQYWLEKEVIVPMVTATGTGRSVYYSCSELVELAVIMYLLSMGLTFESASGVLQQLREIEPNFAKEKSQRRLMLVFDTFKGILKLKKFINSLIRPYQSINHISIHGKAERENSKKEQ